MAPPPSSERFLAMSCSNVGVGPGGTTSMLARVVVVDFKGKVIFDKYVGPTMQASSFDLVPANTNDLPSRTRSLTTGRRRRE
ncbi:hypothetical protein D9615_001434 [Tricholomella constricta]|uniref:Uncharacterized protein n=1 Tax=Tricholomella constricta TaxID=117010 RepID=A0A8H5HKZ2_9AGAR|nr:hypothetical protein D9615_001434 [Tricholomella constricta]